MACATVSSATRDEWPCVDLSRTSIALTEARTNCSKRSWIDVEQRFVFERDAGLRGQREQHALVALGERIDDLFGHRGRGEHEFELGLAVDQLNDADDGVFVVAHRHGHHRLRAIAVLLIERLVEAVFGRFRNLVGVGMRSDLAGERDVAGDRAAGERQHRAQMRTGVVGAGLRDREAQFVGPPSSFSSKNRLPPSARVSSRALRTISSCSFEMSRSAESATPIESKRSVSSVIASAISRMRSASRRSLSKRRAAVIVAITATGSSGRTASPRRARSRPATSSTCSPGSATTIVAAWLSAFDQLERMCDLRCANRAPRAVRLRRGRRR